MATNLLNVPALDTTFPNTIPQTLIQEYPVLTRDIAADAVHRPSDATDAQDVALILSRTPAIPPNVVNQAKHNATILGIEHAIHSVVPVNPFLAQFANAMPVLAGIGANIMSLRDDIAALGARVDNQRIMGHNNTYLSTHTRGRSRFPLKQVAGDGTHLLLGIGFAPNTINHPDTWQLPAAGPPVVGTEPIFFNIPDPIHANLTNRQLCGLVRFYNESFGIVAGDQLVDKARKFWDWMAGF